MQGALYYTNVNEDTVSFVCVPGSHKKWNYIAKNNKIADLPKAIPPSLTRLILDGNNLNLSNKAMK